MSEIQKWKMVEFDKWCDKCRFVQFKETDDPCNECLGNPKNEYSHKPVNFEEGKPVKTTNNPIRGKFKWGKKSK